MAFAHPTLANGVRLHHDKVREQHVLLFPEGALVLNDTAVEVLELCDGERSLDDIAGVLGERYEGADVKDDVSELLDGIGERGLVVDANG
jgi:pyrroloquinoline quinone biosynthesis protein D